MAERGEHLDLGVPPEALGVDERSVHVEENGLQGGAFGRSGTECGDRTGHPYTSMRDEKAGPQKETGLYWTDQCTTRPARTLLDNDRLDGLSAR
ncbi:hypothetical protein GCM10010245_41730 [Streptomyces spectabilis]|nr:hypothetical protein GCM10010245_41730 [Streptomyces spectabilis]